MFERRTKISYIACHLKRKIVQEEKNCKTMILYQRRRTILIWILLLKFFMLRNDKDDLISLNIVFAWMFKLIHESCYHMVKIRYCGQCSKKDEGKNEKVLRKNSKNMFKKEASQYPPKKLSVKWLRFALIAYINFPENSRDYLLKNTLTWSEKEETQLQQNKNSFHRQKPMNEATLNLLLMKDVEDLSFSTS